jgi:hypothetical protein
VRVSLRLRELCMRAALVAPTALAQQAAPTTYELDMSNVNGGTGALAADKFAATGTFGNVGGSASGGSFSLTSGMDAAPPASGSAGDMIFGNSFD